MKPAVGYSNRPASDSPRDIEAWGLIEAARRLILASHNPDDQEQLRAALALNQRLWTIFQASAVDPECPLPADLRENVLLLSMIVDRETFARMVDLDVTKLDQLIDINRQVAAGLTERPTASGQTAPNPIAPGPAAAAPSPDATAAKAPVTPPSPLPAGTGGKLSISI